MAAMYLLNTAGPQKPVHLAHAAALPKTAAGDVAAALSVKTRSSAAVAGAGTGNWKRGTDYIGFGKVSPVV